MRSDLKQELRERLSDGPLRTSIRWPSPDFQITDIIDLIEEIIDDDTDRQELKKLRENEATTR